MTTATMVPVLLKKGGGLSSSYRSRGGAGEDRDGAETYLV